MVRQQKTTVKNPVDVVCYDELSSFEPDVEKRVRQPAGDNVL
ncbi:hypothetical protein HUSEC_26376, partial [Escherichia coli O104:H4 str. LB226692]